MEKLLGCSTERPCFCRLSVESLQWKLMRKGDWLVSLRCFSLVSWLWDLLLWDKIGTVKAKECWDLDRGPDSCLLLEYKMLFSWTSTSICVIGLLLSTQLSSGSFMKMGLDNVCQSALQTTRHWASERYYFSWNKCWLFFKPSEHLKFFFLLWRKLPDGFGPNLELMWQLFFFSSQASSCVLSLEQVLFATSCSQSCAF